LKCGEFGPFFHEKSFVEVKIWWKLGVNPLLSGKHPGRTCYCSSFSVSAPPVPKIFYFYFFKFHFGSKNNYLWNFGNEYNKELSLAGFLNS
jgi:hypothetical protein